MINCLSVCEHPFENNEITPAYITQSQLPSNFHFRSLTTLLLLVTTWLAVLVFLSDLALLYYRYCYCYCCCSLVKTQSLPRPPAVVADVAAALRCRSKSCSVARLRPWSILQILITQLPITTRCPLPPVIISPQYHYPR